jgi:CheY-like chemotaxis protein
LCRLAPTHLLTIWDLIVRWQPDEIPYSHSMDFGNSTGFPEAPAQAAFRAAGIVCDNLYQAQILFKMLTANDKSEATRIKVSVMPDAQPELPLNILLADDSPDNRLLIHAFLEKAGHRLDDAENGAIAATMFKAGNYDLVLMDVQMPVMDGLAATRAIRAWERERGLSRTPVLILTASALDEDVGRSLEAGADLHISKPIKKAALIAAIKNFTSSPSILDDAAA